MRGSRPGHHPLGRDAAVSDATGEALAMVKGPDHTPSTLLNAFTAHMRARGEGRPFTLRGLYEPGTGRVYGEYYYDRLNEDGGGHSLALRVHSAQRDMLEAGRLYTLVGSLEKRARVQGTVELQFVVTSIEHVEDSVLLMHKREQAQNAALAKRDRGFQDVERLLHDQFEQGRQPAVHLIYGEGGIVNRDVESALGRLASSYRLTENRVSLEQPQRLGMAILSAPPGAIVGVVRGGGRLDALDNLALARQVAESSRIVLTALGHEADSTLLDRVADRSFPTPSLLGTFLGDVANRALARRDRARVLVAHNEQLRQQLSATDAAAKATNLGLAAKLRRTRFALLLAMIALAWLLWP